MIGVGRNVCQDLEQRIDAQVVGVLKTGVAGQNLVNRLREDGLGRVFDKLGRAWIGQAFGQLGDDAQGLLQGADGEQASVGDEATAVEGELQL